MSQSLDAVNQWQPALEVNGETVYLTETESIIGRGATATIVIPDGGASRNHARIVWNGKSAGLEDLQSTNGTLLNGRRVTSSPLEQGDVIEIGATRIVFRIVPGAAA
jgi:pSer/pThr/pTyr-binding forkhead associated (FHA) protein